MFEEIREFYRRLDEVLPGPDKPPVPPEVTGGRTGCAGNLCGSCGECCRWFFYLSRHEYDYLEHYLKHRGQPVPSRFRVAVTPEQDHRLQHSEWRCPLYREGVGCTVYEARPLACRLAGPYLPRASRLPPWCVFTRPVRYSTVEEIPLWEQYVRLLRRHPGPPGYIDWQS